MFKHLTLTFLFISVLIQTLQAQQCESGHYYENQTNECQPCDITCQECSGPSNTDCIVCVTGILDEGQCYPDCDNTMYFDTITKKCEYCHHSCLECNGPTQNDCTSCTEEDFLSPDGHCSPRENDYNDDYGSEGENSDSSLCPKGLYFIKGPATCEDQCSSTHYLIDIDQDPYCAPKVALDNRIYTTKKIDEYKVVFNSKISGIFSDLVDKAHVSVLFYSPKQKVIPYTYSLHRASDPSSMIIKMKFDDHLLPSNYLKLIFDLQDDDNQTSFTMAKKDLTIPLYEYYPYSDDTTKAVDDTSAATSVGNTVNDITKLGTNFILQTIHSIRSELMETMISYCIYMNIAFPPNVISYALANFEAMEMFYPNMWHPILHKLEKDDERTNERILQEEGLAIGLNANQNDLRFLTRVGAGITMLFIVGCLIISTDYLLKYLRRRKDQYKKICRVVEYFNIHIKWSYLLNEFISEFQSITFCSLAALLLTRNFTPDAVFDYVVALIFFVLSIAVFVGVFFLNKWIFEKLRNSQTETEKDTSPLIKDTSLKRLNVLHKQYKNAYLVQLLYPILLMARSFGFTLVLFALRGFPVCQIMFLMFSTIAMMIYIIKVKPFRSRIQMIMSIVYEVVFLFIVLMCLTLHIYNQSHMENIVVRSNIGFAIIAGGLTMMVANLMALVFELVELRKYIRKFWRRNERYSHLSI